MLLICMLCRNALSVGIPTVMGSPLCMETVTIGIPTVTGSPTIGSNHDCRDPPTVQIQKQVPCSFCPVLPS